MEFKRMSTSEFNFLFETTLENSMNFGEAMDNIEANGLDDYFYTSANPEDVEEAINSKDKILIDQLHLWLISIDEVGVYIALQQ